VKQQEEKKIERKNESDSENPAIVEGLAKFDFVGEQNPQSGENKSDDEEEVPFNFALVFRTTIPIFRNIRRFLLGTSTTLIYQTTSTEKLLVQRVISTLVCMDCHFWSGSCLRGRPNRLASSPACENVVPKEGHEYNGKQ
jgi:hypothetical protein